MLNKSELISKFSNIYIMLLYSIMTNDVNRVKHYLSNDLYEFYLNIVNNNVKNNQTQMYDELNVYKIEIINQEIINNKEMVVVKIISRYMDYIIDNNTGEIKSGRNNCRIEKENILTFEKELNSKEMKNLITCSSCGANLDINFTGICSYCKSSIDISKIDYILIKINEKKV